MHAGSLDEDVSGYGVYGVKQAVYALVCYKGAQVGEQVFAALCASKVERAWLGRLALRVEFDQEDDKVTRHDRVN